MADYQYVKAWKARNKEKVAEYSRRYHAKHPETHKKAAARWRAKWLDKIREKDRLAHAKRRKADPEGQKVRYARWRAKKENKLAEIAGRPRPSICDLCKKNNRGIVFDHCHQRETFRGWLCDRCNKVLGLIKDDPKLLRKMAKYLERSNGNTYRRNPQEDPQQGIWFAIGKEIPSSK